ncbi:sensor domain-containing protein [Nigerium massiliense]|uniref:sensor domain-containing protein n=1 Tax=Nigerium massiliense TaxID=1522317 RepID=UPI00058C8E80|nr:sensor domain-containing protein [Nigerium massiliense]
MPKGFALPGGYPADNTLQNIRPCFEVAPPAASLAGRTASRFSRDAGEEHYVGNGAITFATVDQARAFMRSAITQSERCQGVKTRGGLTLSAKRTAPSNSAWERSVFTSSQYPAKASGGMTWGQGSLIVRRGANVAVYANSGMYDSAPSAPSAEAVAQVKKILDSLG